MNIEQFQNSTAGKLLRVGERKTAYWAFAPHPLPPALDADWELVGQCPARGQRFSVQK